MRGATRIVLAEHRAIAKFQSTHPVRGATWRDWPARHSRRISIHAPRAGCDKRAFMSVCAIGYFNPRTPCGVRPSSSIPIFVNTIFQSTHPVRGATYFVRFSIVGGNISIHAPRAGCDGATLVIVVLMPNFNPRTPCGVRLEQSVVKTVLLQFQSTHPVRGATGSKGDYTPSDLFQSTHPVRGATISCPLRCRSSRFQSTHPVRGATSRFPRQPSHRRISIHAPRAGCDLPEDFAALLLLDFNPRTPCGVRRSSQGSQHQDGKFQSTHPVRGATFYTQYAVPS